MSETCWAVSIAEVVEAHHNKLHGDKKWLYLELSPRFLTNSINSPYDALSSFTKASKLMRETGIPLEKDFPFSLGPDVKPPKKLMGKIVRIGKAFEANGSDQRIEEESVRTLLDSDLGPVVLVFKTDKSFHHLRPEEIYDTPAELFDAKGHSNLRHHAVVALGYGELDNNPYWYVRNCHGEKWCNAGCGMVSRNLEIQKVWYPKEIKI